MARDVEALLTEALLLAPADRFVLIEGLRASLDPDPDVEDAWAAEVARRKAEFERGAVALLPGPEPLARLRAAYQ